MGLSLHYQGSLGDFTRLPDLLSELEDIALSMGWKSRRIERDVENLEFTGVILRPDDDTESLPFLFDNSGRLRCLADLICYQPEADSRYSYFVSVKTQFGKIETHLWIVGLLRYLKAKYLPDLEVSDEGEYWETGNFAVLDERRNFLASKIAEIADGLSKLESRAETPEDLAYEIEAFFRERFGGGD
jgi:hypothetical protein